MRGFFVALALVLASVLVPSVAEAQFTTPVVTTAARSTDGNTFSTSSVDTSSCTSCLIVVGFSYYNPNTTPTVSDSESNTYSCLTERDASDAATRICYVENATVDATHSWTLNGTAGFGAMAVQVWSGAKASAAFDQQNGASGTGTTLQAGAVTPSEGNELVVSVLNNNTDTGTSRAINSGFTISNQIGYVSGENFPIALAWLVQTSASSVNPEWSWSGSQAANAGMATFKAASAPTGGNCTLMLMGVGKC